MVGRKVFDVEGVAAHATPARLIRSVAVVWRGDGEARRIGVAANERLRPISDALEAVGIEARPVVHSDDVIAATRDVLRRVDGVLVWVDPIGGGENRHRFDEVLREVAAAGVWVSAHPDVVAAMGTKQVLYRTRGMSWGTDVQQYANAEELRRGLRPGLVDGPRVLKPRYGNGGIGVWKVEADGGTTEVLRVQGAEVRDTTVEVIPLDEFLTRCSPAFDHGGCMVDQAFQRRVAEGMVRCYLVGERVVGFARQSAESLRAEPGAATRIMGLPSPKTMFGANAAAFTQLRARMEDEWVPAMRAELGLGVGDLPVLWDADFLLAANGDHVLCEINCSCVTPFPPEAPTLVAAAARDHLDNR